MEHELWFTALLNKLLAGVVTPMLGAIAQIHHLEWVRPENASQPIPNYIAMEVMVILLILIGAILLRRFGFTAALVMRLSVVAVWHIIGRI